MPPRTPAVTRAAERTATRERRRPRDARAASRRSARLVNGPDRRFLAPGEDERARETAAETGAFVDVDRIDVLGAHRQRDHRGLLDDAAREFDETARGHALPAIRRERVGIHDLDAERRRRRDTGLPDHLSVGRVDIFVTLADPPRDAVAECAAEHRLRV